MNADAKAAAEGQVDKGPEEAPFKDEGSFKGGIKDHSSHHDAKEVQRPRKVADIPAEGQTADTQRDADATEKEPEGKEQISAATRDEQEPEEAAAVGIPATESEPSGRGGAAATDKGAGVKSAQAQGAVSKEVHPQAAPSHTTAAEGDASVSKPDGDKAKREEPAEQRLPVTGATEGSTKSAESASGTESGASKDEATGKKQVAMSDEQTAILERGDSMLAEADEGDPKGIQLIRRMQVGHTASRYRPNLCTQAGLDRTSLAWVVDYFQRLRSSSHPVEGTTVPDSKGCGQRMHALPWMPCQVADALDSRLILYSPYASVGMERCPMMCSSPQAHGVMRCSLPGRLWLTPQDCAG